MTHTPLEDIHFKLEKLRAFDSLIDFSKSRIQLDIVLQLAASHKPLSADEIALGIGQRKKPVLDALRKLELKGVIRRTESHRNIYELTDLGRQMIEDLATILGASNLKDVVRSRMYGKVGARGLIKLIIPVYYLHEVLVALGTAKNHELPLTTLAKSVGISSQRLSVYLDPYANSKSEIRLFKKIRREDMTSKIKSLLLGKRKVSIYYKPTDLGLELYYRLPIYVKLKNNRFMNMLIKLFGYYNPKLILVKSSLINLALDITLLALISLIIINGTSILLIPALSLGILRLIFALLLLISHK